MSDTGSASGGLTSTASARSQSRAASSTSSRPPVPLTNLYTPPASCSDIVTWDGDNLWQYGTNQTGGDCYPPNFHSVFNSYYTPGVCPDGWTSASSLPPKSGYDAMCCPQGYILSQTRGYLCASIASSSEVLSSVFYTSTAGSDPIPSGVSFTSFNAGNGKLTIIADVIQVQWQDQNTRVASLMAAKTASTGGRQTAPTPTSTSPVASALPVAPTGSSSGGLSTGAKIGIGVAIPIIVLSLLAIGVIFGLRRRKHRAAPQQEPSEEPKTSHELPPLGHQPQDDRKWEDQKKVGQLPQKPPQEMEAQKFNELSADPPVAELDGQQMQRGSTFKGGSSHTSTPTTPRTPRRGLLR